VHLEDRFLSATELASLVAHGDVALLPYQQFVGSSGLLYRAAQAGRPSIAPSYGLMGWLARRHGLGLVVDAARPQALAEALRHCLRLPATELCDPDGLARFAQTAGDDRFAGALLGDITKLVDDLCPTAASHATGGKRA
jgi:glycosyltransferase involved in cell wall biosynthesis